jgi:sugar/nucleoside kinase (ribokinase family)
LIGIGAINLDYTWTQAPEVAKTEGSLPPDPSKPDQGDEDFYLTYEGARAEIKRRKLTDPTVGGSALLALRAASVVDTDLILGFVGVCGEVPGQDEIVSLNGSLRSHLDFIKSQPWLLAPDSENEGERSPGLAIVRLNEGQRGHIEIAPCANDEFQPLAQKKDPTGDQLARYLSSACWIHMSSLASGDQFSFAAAAVRRARAINPHLTVSFDPGEQYVVAETKTDKQLTDAEREFRRAYRNGIAVADFVFLSQKEAEHLNGDGAQSLPEVQQTFAAHVWDHAANRPLVIMVKHKGHNELWAKDGNTPKRRQFPHKRLKDSKIWNDTGAGDVFAGAFIAGMLSPKLRAHQPLPVGLGARAAAARLASMEKDPFPEIGAATTSFLNDLEHKEKRNLTERIRLIITEQRKSVLVGSVAGVATGIIAGLIVWAIQLALAHP